VNAASRRIARAWRVLTWKHWAWATGIAVGVSMWMVIQTIDRNSYWWLQRLIHYTPWYLFVGYAFIAAIAWVESAARADVPPMRYYVAAMAVAGVGCIALIVSLAPFIAMPPYTVIEGLVDPRPANVDPARRRLTAFFLGFSAVYHACFAALIYTGLHRTREMARALAQAELARSVANREVLAFQLEAAQAEIDPARVIARLEAIERAYDSDPAAADRELDALIAVLREAIPRLRSIPAPALR
jgi:hypothetical protein